MLLGFGVTFDMILLITTLNNTGESGYHWRTPPFTFIGLLTESSCRMRHFALLYRPLISDINFSGTPLQRSEFHIIWCWMMSMNTTFRGDRNSADCSVISLRLLMWPMQDLLGLNPACSLRIWGFIVVLLTMLRSVMPHQFLQWVKSPSLGSLL